MLRTTRAHESPRSRFDYLQSEPAPSKTFRWIQLQQTQPHCRLTTFAFLSYALTATDTTCAYSDEYKLVPLNKTMEKIYCGQKKIKTAASIATGQIQVQKEPVGLMTLSMELRGMIYHELLPRNRRIYVAVDERQGVLLERDRKVREPTEAMLALMGTCSMIRAEVLSNTTLVVGIDCRRPSYVHVQDMFTQYVRDSLRSVVFWLELDIELQEDELRHEDSKARGDEEDSATQAICSTIDAAQVFKHLHPRCTVAVHEDLDIYVYRSVSCPIGIDEYETRTETHKFYCEMEQELPTAIPDLEQMLNVCLDGKFEPETSRDFLLQRVTALVGRIVRSTIDKTRRSEEIIAAAFANMAAAQSPC